MNVLFDISHPAHVHLFRNAIAVLDTNGHETKVVSREKDLTTTLLDAYGIPHTPISKKGETKPSLIAEWLLREIRTFTQARSFDPDVVVSRLNPPAAHISTILGCPNIVFDDSEKAQFAAKITHPFTDVVCTPAAFDRDLGPKQRRYDGFHELAYLHPNRFEPDANVVEDHGIAVDDPYFVVRFVSWGAHHDVGQRGLSPAGKRKLVSLLSDHGDVYITSETELPDEFEQYRLPVPPETIHHLLSYANLYVGDSQTMATEAAVLGTPTIRSNTFAGSGDMSNFVRLETEYELLYSIADEEEAIQKTEELLTTADTKNIWQRNRERLFKDMIDVTEYMVETILAEGEK